jgi:hypothetical protein
VWCCILCRAPEEAKRQRCTGASDDRWVKRCFDLVWHTVDDNAHRRTPTSCLSVGGRAHQPREALRIILWILHEETGARLAYSHD